jgi:uncharacterized protein (TIGR02266 family)
MTVRYRSATLGEFIEHHSYDVSRGGMFIKTPAPFPAGTLLKFEVKIAEEQRLMQGVGRVVWKREGDQAGENAPAGMGIKFIKIDEASHAVIERLVENRGHGGPSAFEQSSPVVPPKSQRMFPERAPLASTPAEGEAPPPVGLPTGEGDSSSPSIEALAEEAVSDSGSTKSGAPTSGTSPRVAKAARGAKLDAPVEKGRAPTASAGGPASGRRWFVVALIVLFVLGMLYVLTHKAPEVAVGATGPSAAGGMRLL